MEFFLDETGYYKAGDIDPLVLKVNMSVSMGLYKLNVHDICTNSDLGR